MDSDISLFVTKSYWQFVSMLLVIFKHPILSIEHLYIHSLSLTIFRCFVFLLFSRVFIAKPHPGMREYR
jgi:hypothetical protein